MVAGLQSPDSPYCMYPKGQWRGPWTLGRVLDFYYGCRILCVAAAFHSDEPRSSFFVLPLFLLSTMTLLPLERANRLIPNPHHVHSFNRICR